MLPLAVMFLVMALMAAFFGVAGAAAFSSVRTLSKSCMLATLLALVSSVGVYKAAFAQPAPAPAAAAADEGVEVLTRGPVHEAFAETVTFDPEPGVIVPQSPPAAIDEVPPEQRLEGANIAWIPGYSAWDDERNDFLWVSGIWRDLPPGRQWVPGYWSKAAEGYQWTSGYWADATVSEVEYLPEPPETVEAGPTTDAPSPDDTWLPGCWVWQNSRYAWRPGFWENAHPDWVWIPAHYVWTPSGYVFVDGYWDYSVDRRGVLFAPVYFSAEVYGRQGFSYSPTTVIDLSVFANHLFWRPQFRHYYFGDYYATRYRNEGFIPWFRVNTGRSGYDPIYAHQRWQHRQDRDWEQQQQADFDNRRDDEHRRPPQTWAAQGLRNASDATSRVGLPGVAALLDDLGRNRDRQLRFQPVDPAERKQFSQHAEDVQRFRQERLNLETKKATDGPAESRTKEFVPAKAKLSGSPIVGKPGVDLGKNRAPPKTYGTPKVDRQIEAQPMERVPEKVMPKDVRHDTGPVAKRDSDYVKQTKKEFQNKLDALLNAMDGEITRLRVKGRNLKDSDKSRWDEKMAVVDTKMETARAALVNLNRASEDTWNDARDESQEAYDDLERTFRAASK